MTAPTVDRRLFELARAFLSEPRNTSTCRALARELARSGDRAGAAYLLDRLQEQGPAPGAREELDALRAVPLGRKPSPEALVRIFSGGPPILSLAFRPGGGGLAVGRTTGPVELFSWPDRDPAGNVSPLALALTGRVSAMTFTPDGSHLLAGLEGRNSGQASLHRLCLRPLLPDSRGELLTEEPPGPLLSVVAARAGIIAAGVSGGWWLAPGEPPVRTGPTLDGEVTRALLTEPEATRVELDWWRQQLQAQIDGYVTAQSTRLALDPSGPAQALVYPGNLLVTTGGPEARPRKVQLQAPRFDREAKCPKRTPAALAPGARAAALGSPGAFFLRGEDPEPQGGGAQLVGLDRPAWTLTLLPDYTVTAVAFSPEASLLALGTLGGNVWGLPLETGPDLLGYLGLREKLRQE